MVRLEILSSLACNGVQVIYPDRNILINEIFPTMEFGNTVHEVNSRNLARRTISSMNIEELYNEWHAANGYGHTHRYDFHLRLRRPHDYALDRIHHFILTIRKWCESLHASYINEMQPSPIHRVLAELFDIFVINWFSADVCLSGSILQPHYICCCTPIADISRYDAHNTYAVIPVLTLTIFIGFVEFVYTFSRHVPLNIR